MSDARKQWFLAPDAFGGTLSVRKVGRYEITVGMTDHGEGFQCPDGWWWVVRYQKANWEVSGWARWEDVAKMVALNMVRRLERGRVSHE